MSGPAIKVCLDARIAGDQSGGLKQVLIGLASAFSALEDSSDEFAFLVEPGGGDWLRSYVRGPCSIIESARTAAGSQRQRIIRTIPGARELRRLAIASRRGRLPGGALLRSDGTVEAAGADVIHFVTQAGFRTAIPSLYQPHDLQHVHLPHLFSPGDRRYRDAVYRELAAQADVVIAMTAWGASDVVSELGVSPERVAVVPWASVLSSYGSVSEADVESIRQRYSLPSEFALYPAQTWRHKNHLTLLDALAELRHRGVVVPLVCTGHRNDFYSVIERRARDLELDSQVRFLGFLDGRELAALYRGARLLVFPSLFEGWGLPLSEAFSASLPAACSDLPVLREQGVDACRWFDPQSSSSIASAILDVWTSDVLRGELSARGREIAAGQSWEQTARRLSALYRRVAGVESREERATLLVEGSR